MLVTLRVSLSGTFLRSLPELVTTLKGHSFSPRPPKGSGTNNAVDVTQRLSTHVNMLMCASDFFIKEKVSSGFRWFCFYLCWRK